jgi:hypothetical protein
VHPRSSEVTPTERGLMVEIPSPGLAVLRVKTVAR